MSSRLRPTLRSAVFASLFALVGLSAEQALAAPPVVGSGNVATADPLVPRPATTPCTVTLFSNVAFADFTPKPFSFTPPAACPGPWAKVVLEADFSVNTGRQFDRTAQIALGHVNLYYGTTQEPSSTIAPSWHVERDVTDYSPLFAGAATGETNLGNLVNPTFTSTITGSADLQFYPLVAHQAPPRTADQVLPLATDPGGAKLLATTNDVLAPTFTLPRNVESAALDVVAQSQSTDEFWFTCVPDDQAGALFSCPGTAFRETQVTIDGQPAGVAPVYPWIFTGGIDPLLWRPIVGVQTLNFKPFRVDLTPFAGLLSDGQPHTVGVSVFGAHNYFLVAATLLVYQDPGAATVSGQVTRNTLSEAPNPVVDEDLTTAADGTISGTIDTRSEREWRIEGFVDTSHGRVETSVKGHVDFSNRQTFLVSANDFVQNIRQTTEFSSETETEGRHDERRVESRFSFPLELDITFTVNPDGSGFQTTRVDQSFVAKVDRNGSDSRRDRDHDSESRVTNNVRSKDTLLFNSAGAITGFENRNSSQSYRAKSPNSCYSRTITAVDGLLTSVVDGVGCGH